MKEHFEEVWVESEDIIYKYSNKLGSKYVPFNNIMELLEKFNNLGQHLEDKEKLNEYMGQILVNLSFFSKFYDINVWTAMKKEANQIRVDLLELEYGE